MFIRTNDYTSSVTRNGSCNNATARSIAANGSNQSINLRTFIRNGNILTSRFRSLSKDQGSKIKECTRDRSNRISISYLYNAQSNFQATTSTNVKFARLRLLRGSLFRNALLVNGVFRQVIRHRRFSAFLLNVFRLFGTYQRFNFQPTMSGRSPFNARAFNNATEIRDYISATCRRRILNRICQDINLQVKNVRRICTNRVFITQRSISTILSKSARRVKRSNAKDCRRTLRTLFFRFLRASNLTRRAILFRLRASNLRIISFRVRSTIKRARFKSAVFRCAASFVRYFGRNCIVTVFHRIANG